MGFFLIIGVAVIILGFVGAFFFSGSRDAYGEAMELAANGNFLDARALIRNKLEYDNGDIHAHYAMSKLYSMESDYTNEAKHLEIIKKIGKYPKDSDIVTVSNRIADIYYQKDKFDAAFFHYLDTIEKEPKNPIALIRLAFMALSQKEFSIADTYLQRLEGETVKFGAYFLARGIISGTLNLGKEEEFFQKAYKLEKTPVSGFLYAMSLSKIGKHKDSLKLAQETMDLVQDEYIRYLLCQFLMTEYIQTGEFPQALKYAKQAMEMAYNNEWNQEIIDAEVHYAMIGTYMGKFDDISESLVHAEFKRIHDSEIIKVANFKFKFERNMGDLTSLQKEYPLLHEMQLLSSTLFPPSRYYELSGVKSNKSIHIRGIVDENGRKTLKKLDNMAEDKTEKFNQLSGVSFKNICTRMVLSYGYRVSREIVNPDGDGLNFLGTSKENKDKKAIFRIRKWKDTKVSDVFLRDLMQSVTENSASLGYIIGDFELTDGAKKFMDANAGKIIAVNDSEYENLLAKCME